jgi:coenzyme F420-reducing hydrogenase alpha subunit
MRRRRKITVGALARVEGEGGFSVGFKNQDVVEARFNIFEPPRLFEAFLKGRHYCEAPDITARICGICPMAHSLSAIDAFESGFGIQVDESVKALRRFMYCGEWIESHVLHIYLLHAPDFFECQDFLELTRKDPERMKKGLALKKLGNDMMSIPGGREIHPVNLKIGGFYRAPGKAELASLADRLKRAMETAYETIRWTASFPFPDFEQEYQFVCLHDPRCYAMTEGVVVSNTGLQVTVGDLEQHIREEQVDHSTSLHAIAIFGAPYAVGPMARFNLNCDQLSPLARRASDEVNLRPPVTNPFKSIVVRSVEVLHACEEALRIIETYEPPQDAPGEIRPRAAACCGATEAPRGLCFHRYHVDEDGQILEARIVPPTSQNQKVIERDLLHFSKTHAAMDREKLSWLCEQVIRNYDPCISCSCHTLDLQHRPTAT